MDPEKLKVNVLRLVGERKNCQFIADAWGISKLEVQRIAEAAGWRHDPTTDKFLPTPSVRVAVHGQGKDSLTTTTSTGGVLKAPERLSMIAEAKKLADASPKIRRALASVEKATDALEAVLADERDRIELIQRRQALRAEMDAVERALKDTKSGTRTEQPSPAQPEDLLTADARTIRTWATDQGLDVPPRGVLPRRIIDAYREAH